MVLGEYQIIHVLPSPRFLPLSLPFRFENRLYCLTSSPFIFVCTYTHAHTVRVRTEAAEQSVGVSSLPPPCGPWGLNSSHQPRQLAPLPTEPSHGLLNCRISLCSLNWPGSQYIIQRGLKITATIMPRPPKYWDYRYVLLISSCMFSLVQHPFTDFTSITAVVLWYVMATDICIGKYLTWHTLTK